MYPTVSPPPTDTGALTWPRRLQKWLDVNPDTRLTRTSTFITLPAFTGNGQPWLGYSDIVTAFNYEGPNNLSLKAISSIPVNPNYVLCVSWRVGNILKRYLIWDAVGSVMPEGITTYTNQKVGKNFRFEVWSTSQGNATETNNINFYTSVLGKVDYRYGTDSQLVGADSQVVDFGYPVATIPNTTPITNTYVISLSGSDIGPYNGYYYYNGIVFIPEHITLGNRNVSIRTISAGNYELYDAGYYNYGDPVMYFGTINNLAAFDIITQWTINPTGGNTGTTAPVSSMTVLFNLPLTFPPNAVSVTN
jgi:hypothetical protein